MEGVVATSPSEVSSVSEPSPPSEASGGMGCLWGTVTVASRRKLWRSVTLATRRSVTLATRRHLKAGKAGRKAKYMGYRWKIHGLQMQGTRIL